MALTIRAKEICGGEPLEIRIDGDRVISVSTLPGDGRDLPFVSPGFIDIQLNGYAGKDYSELLTGDDISSLVFRVAESGTTRHFPTIVTNSEAQIIASLKAIAAARKADPLLRKAIPGIHVEGPFISPADGARGAHNPAYIRTCDFDEFRRWQEAAEGLIRLVTVSPENENALEFIRRITKAGVVVAIGHTMASPEMIAQAVDAGARLSTHLGNGSPAMLPRLRNFLWKQLAEDRLCASIIADGFHLPDFVLDCYSRCKGRERTILVSDAVALAGSSPGNYSWNGMDVTIFPDGHLGLKDTNNLAGASLLLDTCIPHMHESTSFSLAESVTCATVNPARLLNLPLFSGAGESADLTVFSYEKGSKLKIHLTLLDGVPVYEDDSLKRE